MPSMSPVKQKFPAEYKVWKSMKDRCFNRNCKGFRFYGGRGIVVCPEWANSFGTFICDMGPRPSDDHTIDRINSNGNYCKENCRWVHYSLQNRNRRDTVFLTAFGKTCCLAEWAESTGLSASCIHKRLGAGWTPERAISEQVESRYQVTIGGQTKPIGAWARILGYAPETLRARVRRGEDPQKVVEFYLNK